MDYEAIQFQNIKFFYTTKFPRSRATSEQVVEWAYLEEGLICFAEYLALRSYLSDMGPELEEETKA